LALPQNIILVGFMASGKSRVGRILARHTGWPLVDADDEIVRRCGKSVQGIFDEDGEVAFRVVERSVMADLCAGSGRIVAAGGGAFVDPDNRRRMLASGLVFCLGATAETIHRRLTPLPPLHRGWRGGGEAGGEASMERGLRGEARRQLCRELRQRQTPAEEFFWELVRDRRFDGLKFRRQYPLGGFIPDFYCPEYKLAVELDGSVHQHQAERDQARDEAINRYGIRVVHIKNADILERPEEVLEELRKGLTPRPPLHQRWRGGGEAGGEARPLLAEDNSLERIRTLMAQRAEAYAQAHHTIETDLLTPEEVARGILGLCPGITVAE
jgi:shikimate kinase/very-short-patch-repair endonuclease